jgi:senataxin
MALAYHDHATATQSVEPEMAILLRRNIRGLVAIGDPQQLPSVISNQDLRIKGFAISMFERLLKAGSPHTLLDVQYRMDPMISMWPSGAFYNGQIVDGDNVQDLGRSPPWQKASGLMTAPYSFFNIPGVEERNNDTRSYRNVVEANIIVGFLKGLMAQFKSVAYTGIIEIGCVAGYTEQVQLLNRKISSVLPLAKSWQTTSRINRIEIPCPPHCTVIVDIASVDAFQGQERDIMLFATTRANANRNIGFLSKILKCVPSPI